MHRVSGAIRWTVVAVLVCAVAGCAGLSREPKQKPFPEALPEFRSSAPLPVTDLSGAPPNDPGRSGIGSGQAAASPARTSEQGKEGQARQEGQPALEQPERLAQEEPVAEEEEYDPWEPFNVKVFEFNRKLDKYLIKPVAEAYNKVVPDALQRGIKNAFHNIRFVPRLLNNVFQAKFKGAGLEASRFLLNSTLGVAGFFDVAKNTFGLETPDEDTGQTLGVYGVNPGPYLILPLLPPLTVRDTVGFVVDLALDPFNYFVFAVAEIDGAPRLVTNLDTAGFAQLGTRVGEIENQRSLDLERFQGVEEATVDLYGAVRNAYLQKRAQAIKE